MRVHITGCDGWIASWLGPALQRRDHVLSFSDSDFAYEPWFCLRDETPDLVVHLGALVGRAFGEQDPSHTIALNASSTALWAQACAAAEVPMLYASSSEVYGDMGRLTAHEFEVPNLPHNLYGLTKRWGEEAAQLYLPPTQLVIARLSMPYGPGHPPGFGRAALTNFCWDAICGQPLQVHRNAERSWCWIGDTVAALVLLVEQFSELSHAIFNVGRDDNPRSMEEVAQLACKLANSKSELILVDPPKNQTLVKRLPTFRLRELGWEPAVELETGIRHTIRWLREWNKAGQPRESIWLGPEIAATVE